MSDYQPTTSQTNTPSSIGYANPKVLEKKLQQQNDWAKLAQKQAVINAQLNEQEKLQKQLKKEDLEKNLFVMIQQKQSNKKHFDYNQRVKDYTDVKAVQEEYENQLRRAREDRNDVKKTLANELVREIHLKEQERRRKLDNDKQVESKIINDALDDLRKDSMMKIQKKNTINHVFNSHLQERQEEKRRRYEQDQYEKEMERKHVNRMTYMEQNRMGAHMMVKHFQNFFEKQKKMGEIYMSTVANDQKEREQQVNAYITRGVQNDNRKADEEDAQRRLKKDHQTRSLSENVQIQQQEKDQQQREKRNSKKSQGEIAVIDNYYHQDYDKKVKQFKASQAHIYKNALDDQIREAGIRKIKASHEIPEDQKRMHFNHAENTLAKINERTSNNIPVKARPLENSSPFLDGPADLSPVNYGHHRRGNLSLNASSVVDLRERGNMSVNASPIGQPQVFQNGYITPNVRASLDNLMSGQNFSGKRIMPQQNIYNPITNPAPVVRKPYLNFEHVKEYQEKSLGSYYQSNKSLVGNKSFV